MHGLNFFSIEYEEGAETSPVPKTPDLGPRMEEQYQLEALTCLEYVLNQVLERVDEKLISPTQDALTESVNTSEINSGSESDQPSLTPDMSSIRGPEEPLIISHYILSETKLTVVINKTQEIILEFLLRSAEIYLAIEERSGSETKVLNKSERKHGNGAKGNKLRAPYKDRKSQVPLMRRPFHYSKPKESLFYKVTMVRVKKQCRVKKPEGKERSGKKERASLNVMRKTIREAREAV